MKNLTSLEIRVLTAYRLAGTEATGAEDAEWMKADNFTFQTAQEIADRTGLELSTVKGVIGSLVKKGLLATERIKREENQALTDEGIEAAFNTASELGAAVDEILNPAEAAIFMERLEAGSDPYEGMTPGNAAILEAKIESHIRARNPKTLKLSDQMVEVDLDHPVGSNPEEVSE